MADVDHFSYGLITPVLAYAMSVFGSLLGLTCTAHAQVATTVARRLWFLLLAAWAIGGTGIWVMHFIAMLGFTIPEAQIHYDVPLTTASAVLAVTVVATGLCTAGLGRPHPAKIVLGGLLTGSGVAAMHYTGMAALRFDGTASYDRTLVAASVGIAVVAATVALWFTVTVRRPAAIAGSALVMGVAVCGMHYTGMYAMVPQVHGAAQPAGGVPVFTLLLPIVLLVILAAVALVYALLAAPTTPAAPVPREPGPQAPARRPDAASSPEAVAAPGHHLSAAAAGQPKPRLGSEVPTTRRQSIPRAARRAR